MKVKPFVTVVNVLCMDEHMILSYLDGLRQHYIDAGLSSNLDYEIIGYGTSKKCQFPCLHIVFFSNRRPKQFIIKKELDII